MKKLTKKEAERAHKLLDELVTKNKAGCFLIFSKDDSDGMSMVREMSGNELASALLQALEGNERKVVSHMIALLMD